LVRRVLGDLLLQLGEVRLPLVVHALHGLLLALVGLVGLLGGHVGLLQRLLDLLGGVLRIDLVGLKRGLVAGLLALLLVELVLHVLGRLLELVGGVLGLLGAGHRHVHIEVVLGALLLHAGVVDLVGRVAELLGPLGVGVLVPVGHLLE